MAVMEEGSVFQRFRYTFLSEVWIEVVCLIMGWALIFQDSPFAALRCFRIFRYVWYSEFYRARKGTVLFPLTFLCHVVLQYLEKIGQELFTTTSKGGTVVLGFFFYLAYVFGIVFWQSTATLPLVSPEGGTNQTLSECDTLPHCFLIMLRLSFFDGSGFDFLKSVIDYGNGGWVALLILYMCISAFVLLNGLIGIFGGAFASAMEEEEKEQEEIKEKQEKETIQNIAKGMERLEQVCMKLQEDITDMKRSLRGTSY